MPVAMVTDTSRRSADRPLRRPAALIIGSGRAHLRTLGLALAFCSAFASALCAQNSKTLDLRTRHTRKSFYVILAARGGSTTGHAFVLWGIEDNVHHRSTIQAFGL